MKPTFHCLFEQSGTFKNILREYGYRAYDYDILNDFGETDYQKDLYAEIMAEFVKERETIFSNMKENDYVLAFFPCTRFEDQIILSFQGANYSMKNWDVEKKLFYAMKLHDELAINYKIISMLAIVCIRKNLKLVIENPNGTSHYLKRYWCIKPTIIDNDRSMNGDDFKKPTMYYFINCEPKNNLYFGVMELPVKKIETTRKRVERSIINKEYARKFIKQYLIDEESEN